FDAHEGRRDRPGGRQGVQPAARWGLEGGEPPRRRQRLHAVPPFGAAGHAGCVARLLRRRRDTPLATPPRPAGAVGGRVRGGCLAAASRAAYGVAPRARMARALPQRPYPAEVPMSRTIVP